ncbi:MAG TPA: HD domain-containing phosphohydrolase [Mycobacteriales bacterium]|nr:HD domain-containing phosphohydrolase [Mycobacteriales bacterium]
MTSSARAYVSLVVTAALVAVAAGAAAVSHWGTVIALVALTVVTMSLSIQLPDRIAMSLAFVVDLAAVEILGPSGAVLVGAAHALFFGRMPLVKRLFNGAQAALCCAAAAHVYVLLGGPVGHLDRTDFPGVLLPASASALTYCLANVALVSVIISASTGTPLTTIWRRAVGGVLVAYVGYLPLSIALAGLWTTTAGPLSALLMLVPLLVARELFSQSVEERASYDATVRALMAAVETKDIYTRGHSERVGRGTAMIAHEFGYRGDKLDSVRLAGLLHDLGKLGVRTGVLRKSGKLTDDEYAEVSRHPVHGVRMLADIEFLADALVAVHHHHERLDGRGYPLGLAGDAIPESARIVSVADAFDSMTSTRSYRRSLSVPDAVAELRRCAGTQFDPVFVEALVRAVERDGWTLAEPGTPGAPEAPDTAELPAPVPTPAPAPAAAVPPPRTAVGATAPSRTAADVVPSSRTAPGAVPPSRTAADVVPPSCPAPGATALSRTAADVVPSAVPLSRTAADVVPSSGTAPAAVPLSRTAADLVPLSRTAADLVPPSRTAPGIVVPSRAAPDLVPPSRRPGATAPSRIAPDLVPPSRRAGSGAVPPPRTAPDAMAPGLARHRAGPISL